MITAREKGRSLELIVGGGDETIDFLVPPISAAAGATLLADWLSVAFAQVPAEEAPAKMESIARAALGDDVFEKITELRWGEQEQIVNSAFMWNAQGGGIELVNLYLEGGLPKARAALLDKVGMTGAWELLQASLAGASADLARTVASLDTPTPSGTEAPTDPPQ
jgi:hypothetical protein